MTHNERQRAEFEAWAASIGFCVTGKYAETIDVLCAESAFKAGYKAALQSQDRVDAERYRYLRDSAQLYSHFGDIDNSGWCVMRRDHTLKRVFTYNGPDLDEAIDHARRIEGES